MKWRPIEEAPQGEFILVFSEDGVEVAFLSPSGRCFYKDIYGVPEIVFGVMCWMPLPEPPTGKGWPHE